MTKDIANVAASVHRLLLNKAKKSSRPFNELLQYFAIERFIYQEWNQTLIIVISCHDKKGSSPYLTKISSLQYIKPYQDYYR